MMWDFQKANDLAQEIGAFGDLLGYSSLAQTNRN